jgi:hypothetical protein
MARIHIQADRLIVSARENVGRNIREKLRSEIAATVDAIAATLDEIAYDASTLIRTGPDQPPSPEATRARSAMDALNTIVMQITPEIGGAGAAELANLASFNDCLASLTRLIERPLDEPPSDVPSFAPTPAVSAPTEIRDPALVRYCLKVGLSTVIGYIIGIWSQRPELSVILTTVIITALPTYGASLRKMILRIVGAVLGGLISLLTIIIVTPNFETLPAYLLALFVVFYVSAYSSLSSGRVAYAGKQIGTTFAIVFAGLSPAADVYGPLWRIWGILLGTLVVTLVFVIVWSEYAGDSLMPRLRRVIRDTLALAPGGSASASEVRIEATTSETMRLLAEILAVADDAQLEGRRCVVDHGSIVQSAGTLRRIANRLAGISMGRILTPPGRLDDETESAREATLAGIRSRLESWQVFFEASPSFDATRAATAEDSHGETMPGLDEFSHRLEEDSFARISDWTLEQRRSILAELQSMRRLQVLMSELDRYLSGVAQPARQSATFPRWLCPRRTSD